MLRCRKVFLAFSVEGCLKRESGFEMGQNPIYTLVSRGSICETPFVCLVSRKRPSRAIRNAPRVKGTAKKPTLPPTKGVLDGGDKAREAIDWRELFDNEVAEQQKSPWCFK